MVPDPKYKLEVFKTADDLSRSAAEFIIAVANTSIAAKGRFLVSFSGGQTPEKLYSLLAGFPFRGQMQWRKTFIFWGDERCVPPGDERNNAHRAKSILLDKVGIPLVNIHAVPVNLSPENAAMEYEKMIADFFGNDLPSFDLVLLGLGENGHTASLFPGTKVIAEKREGVRAVYVEEEKMFRITMTAPLINRSRYILFLVTGEKKAGILKTVFTASYQPERYPAQLIKPLNGEMHWYADRAAASLVTS